MEVLKMNVTRKNSKSAVDFTLSKGFTLIELLVVMAILGLLAVVGISSFRSSQAKARDAQRKSDLQQVQRALEMYYNDHSSYPLSTLIIWGEEFKDIAPNNTIYMKELPTNPSGGTEYCYQSTSSTYQL